MVLSKRQSVEKSIEQSFLCISEIIDEEYYNDDHKGTVFFILWRARVYVIRGF